jgi:GNAT superfamily N-acetyltransferase
MNDARSWVTRRYEPGDEIDLLALFNRVFGKARSLEHWRWQFARNPYAPPTIVVARRKDDGLLVGSHVVMPIALDLAGERVLAAHTLDLVVHEDHRREGIFETTARECFAWCLERGMRAVIAFPNDQSYPGFVRTLGWSRILEPTRWDLRIGLSGALGRTTPAARLAWLPDRMWRAVARWRSGVDRTWRAEWRREAPPDTDTLWAECSPELRVSLWKDREYLAWRYDLNPDHRFEHVTLREGDRLRALAVVLCEGGRATICDWLSPRRAGLALGRSLVRAVCRGALEREVDRVSFVGADDGYFARCLRVFRSRPAPESVLTGRGLEAGDLDARVRDGRNWCVTYGDADYV